jgi:hypothetical protein
MKKTILSLAAATLLSIAASSTTFASTKSGKGKAIWTIETNELNRNYTVVRFYNEKQELVYEEHIAGRYLDIKDARLQRKLNKLSARIVERSIVRAAL